MSKPKIHIQMLGWKKLIFCLLFLMLQIIVQAQKETDTLVVDDIPIEETMVEEEKIGTIAVDTIQSVIAETYAESEYEGARQFDMRQGSYDTLDYELRKTKDTGFYNNDEDFWYKNYRPTPKKKATVEEPVRNEVDYSQSETTRNLLLALAIGLFVALLVWFLMSNDILKFDRKNKTIENAQVELNEENIHEADFDRLLAKARADGNYPLAVRIQYLQVLKQLADKQLIDYKIDASNAKYVNQLFSTDYYKDFFALTRAYEYIWYGEYPINQEKYAIINNDFDNFNKRIT
jgi:hypothetical protein